VPEHLAGSQRAPQDLESLFPPWRPKDASLSTLTRLPVQSSMYYEVDFLMLTMYKAHKPRSSFGYCGEDWGWSRSGAKDECCSEISIYVADVGNYVLQDSYELNDSSD
jgi:hypothetical protein